MLLAKLFDSVLNVHIWRCFTVQQNSKRNFGAVRSYGLDMDHFSACISYSDSKIPLRSWRKINPVILIIALYVIKKTNILHFVFLVYIAYITSTKPNKMLR